MKHLFTALAAAATLQLSTAPRAQAQPDAAAAYAGPRYPGGPDSLRALVYRSTRTTTPAPAGKMLVQFELQPNGQAYNLTMLRPPAPLNPALVKATATALDYLEAHMPAWQPGAASAPPVPDQYRKINLAFDFTSPLAAQPNYYADQNPVFPNLDLMADGRSQKDSRGTTEGTAKNLASGLQKQAKYPPYSLRHGGQGTVYVYFEVAENGAIEHRQILGTEGSIDKALEGEVMRVVKLLPSATSPATAASRPVRVYYALPLTFKIQ